MKHKTYDYQRNAQYEKFILPRYENLSNPGKSLLLCGLLRAERDTSGFCEPVSMGHEQLAVYAFMSRPTVKKALDD